uniref:Uncharacterized protein n=1 Tax=Timema tahoe TaxID=61484 RepID=A0A7R9NVU7_9NEOP|nr:unnamed protein product [Timema tahoe]
MNKRRTRFRPELKSFKNRRTPARYEDANSRYRAELFCLRPLDLSSASLKPILWDGGREAERRGVASQLTKVSFRANKNRRIAETVDGASYRTSLAEKSYVWKYQFSRERVKCVVCGYWGSDNRTRTDRVNNEWVLKESGLKGNPIGQCERGVSRWFGYVERTGVGRVTKQIYEGRVCASKGRVNINRVAQNSGRGCQIASTLLSSLIIEYLIAVNMMPLGFIGFILQELKNAAVLCAGVVNSNIVCTLHGAL